MRSMRVEQLRHENFTSIMGQKKAKALMHHAPHLLPLHLG